SLFQTPQPVPQQPLPKAVPADPVTDWVKAQDPSHRSPKISPAASVAASPEGSIYSSQLGQVMETMLKMNEKLVDSLKERSSSTPSYRKFPDLPVFEGKIAEWPLFKAELEQSTAQWKIQEVENIGRLRKCLKGDARDEVLSL